MSSQEQYHTENPTLVKEVVTTVLAIILVLSGLNIAFSSSAAHSQEETQKTDPEMVVVDEVISISLVVSTDTDIYIMQEEVAAGSTVFDLMEQASEKNDFSFSYTESSRGVFVEEIYGVANDTTANTYWTYTVNDELVEVGISEYELDDGDDVDWSYGVITEPEGVF